MIMNYCELSFMQPFSDGASANSSNTSIFPIHPILPESSSHELYAQITVMVLYTLGSLHIILSLWMLAEHMLLISPYMTDELRSYW